jgi:hypothetical protein
MWKQIKRLKAVAPNKTCAADWSTGFFAPKLGSLPVAERRVSMLLNANLFSIAVLLVMLNSKRIRAKYKRI